MSKINTFSVLDTNALWVLVHKNLFLVSQKAPSYLLKGYLLAHGG